MTIWRRTDESGYVQVTIHVDGKPITVRDGDSVATALLANGYSHFSHHPKTGKPLAPQCLIGVCFGCLCTVDGRPGVQACLEPVRKGLKVSLREEPV